MIKLGETRLIVWWHT